MIIIQAIEALSDLIYYIAVNMAITAVLVFAIRLAVHSLQGDYAYDQAMIISFLLGLTARLAAVFFAPTVVNFALSFLTPGGSWNIGTGVSSTLVAILLPIYSFVISVIKGGLALRLTLATTTEMLSLVSGEHDGGADQVVKDVIKSVLSMSAIVFFINAIPDIIRMLTTVSIF